MGKPSDFIDMFKDEINKRKRVEGREIEKDILEFHNFTDSAIMRVKEVKLVSRDIGSAFFFHVEDHNKFNSPSSLLGDVRGGSVVVIL